MIAASPTPASRAASRQPLLPPCERRFREAPHAGSRQHDARIRRSREGTREALLNEPNAVPLIVLSAARDPVEAINSLLRRAGQPAHCTWIPALRDLGDALTQLNPQLLVHVASTPEELEAVMGVRDQLAPAVPVLELAPEVDEERIAAGLALGARDVVTLANPARLQAVVLRELRVFRIERTLDASVRSAHDARSQLDTVLQRSNDAILQVQEGIVIEANPA